MDIALTLKFKKEKKMPVNEISISHGLQKSDFSVSAYRDDSAVGFISFADEKNKRHYVLAALYDKKLGLASLPLLGNIPMLKDVCIDSLLLTAASLDTAVIPIKSDAITQIKKGLHFISELSVPNKKLSLCVHLFGDEPEPSNEMALIDSAQGQIGGRIQIDKNIGPFALKALGVAYKDSWILFDFDAALSLSGISFSLDGLLAGYNTSSGKMRFDIQGLSLDMRMGGITVSGGFLKRDEGTYSGSLLVGMSKLSVMAVGSYTTPDSPSGVDSLFAFALLNASIGGPPCFFITGLALGFGYNRLLEVPSIKDLEEFPLLKAAQGDLNSAEILKSEMELFKPRAGANWIAAGVLFNSFKMIDSIAMLTVAWGSGLEIDLLGRSVLDVPYKSPNPIAHAVLLLKASFKPESSLIAVDAALSSESYVLSKDCHLSGEFAFYTWYAGEHAGDFVLTLGGYHPSYNKPAHYPSAKRLGFEWRITGDLSAWGGVYFAITPSCIMAGGCLHLLYSTSGVKAWLDAYVDILMRWKPYYYDIGIGVCIGVCVDLALFDFELDLSCDLHIWGPEFSGVAHVKLYCISFSIAFGAKSPQYAEPVSAPVFIDSFLPKPTAKGDYGGCSANVSRGILAECKDQNDESFLKICADQLEFTASSIVPSKSILLNDEVCVQGGADLFIRPCGTQMQDSTLMVSFKMHGKLPVDKARLTCVAITENVPCALWAPDSQKRETITAFTGLAVKIIPFGCYTMRFLTQCAPDTLERTIRPANPIQAKRYDPEDAYAQLSKISDPAVARVRKGIISELGADWAEINPGGIANNPEAFFYGRPLLATTGG